MICPTCGKVIPDKITINTKNGDIQMIGYDLNHYPDTWAERIAKMKLQDKTPSRFKFEIFTIREYEFNAMNVIYLINLRA